jgi:NTE family protein
MSQENIVPVEFIQTDQPDQEPDSGIGLCLSGGGYRAMLFHTGSLLRLYEAGVLEKVDRISSVSGGSITSAVLALNWSALSFSSGDARMEFIGKVVDPIRNMARHTIDASSIIEGLILPGTISDKIASDYEKHLYGAATLQNFPDKPRFVINATNVQSAALWRFSKPYMRDWRVGMVKNPKVKVAVAVDNLGLETVWKRYKTVLVSDGGGKTQPEEEPKKDWARHSYRILNVIDNQVRSLRYRQLISAYRAGLRGGAYWGIRTNIADYAVGDALPCPQEWTDELAATPTRLKRVPEDRQRDLINWGYAVCDAAVRKYYDPSLAAPVDFPIA